VCSSDLYSGRDRDAVTQRFPCECSGADLPLSEAKNGVTMGKGFLFVRKDVVGITQKI
jgi:hypothetical protein